MSVHVRPLASGPLDLVGDVHGEIRPLRRLLAALGYDEQGVHPDGRQLVFVGDLVDRGPDSLEVTRLIRRLVEAGRAQCVVGNHELNLLIGKERAGNEWFWGREQRLRDAEALVEQRLADDREREEVLFFIQSLPLVLEREDLRVVHACWDGALVDLLRGEMRGLADLFYAYERDLTLEAVEAGHAKDSLEADLARQNLNPVTVLTSGKERPTAKPFVAGGRTRRVERVPWWEEYEEEPTVVFGHYWRAVDQEERPVKAGPYLFDGVPWQHALGPRRNAWCLDYSVGARNVERAQGGARTPTALVAMRFPELELVDHRGEVHATA